MLRSLEIIGHTEIHQVGEPEVVSRAYGVGPIQGKVVETLLSSAMTGIAAGRAIDEGAIVVDGIKTQLLAVLGIGNEHEGGVTLIIVLVFTLLLATLVFIAKRWGVTTKTWHVIIVYMLKGAVGVAVSLSCEERLESVIALYGVRRVITQAVGLATSIRRGTVGARGIDSDDPSLCKRVGMAVIIHSRVEVSVHATDIGLVVGKHEAYTPLDLTANIVAIDDLAVLSRARLRRQQSSAVIRAVIE